MYTVKDKECEVKEIEGEYRLVYLGQVCPYPIRDDATKENVLNGKAQMFNRWANKMQQEHSENVASSLVENNAYVSQNIKPEDETCWFEEALKKRPHTSNFFRLDESGKPMAKEYQF